MDHNMQSNEVDRRGAINLIASVSPQVSQLRHHWLQNLILNWSATEVAYAWRTTGWPNLQSESSLRLREATELIEILEDAFSPAQLVDQLKPLSHLTEKAKRQIKEAVHAVYLQRSGIQELQRRLKGSIAGMQEALGNLNSAWEYPATQQAEEQVREQWEEVLIRARTLLDVLGSLPKKIVLP